jgi:hypothetical protein
VWAVDRDSLAEPVGTIHTGLWEPFDGPAGNGMDGRWQVCGQCDVWLLYEGFAAALACRILRSRQRTASLDSPTASAIVA